MPDPIQKMNIEEWIGALRGGGYRQTGYALHREDTFCALGVLADTQGVTWEETRREQTETTKAGTLYGFRQENPHPDLDDIVWDGTIPQNLWEAWTGLPRTVAEQVTDMNDDQVCTFEQIADALKEALQ